MTSSLELDLMNRKIYLVFLPDCGAPSPGTVEYRCAPISICGTNSVTYLLSRSHCYGYVKADAMLIGNLT